jgi:hypothetical protein
VPKIAYKFNGSNKTFCNGVMFHQTLYIIRVTIRMIKNNRIIDAAILGLSPNVFWRNSEISGKKYKVKIAIAVIIMLSWLMWFKRRFIMIVTHL